MKKPTTYSVLGKEKPCILHEDVLQKLCMTYFKLQYKGMLGFHVPNGGKRNAREGKKFKEMGVLAGVSDILILEQRRGYTGLVVELKRKGGTVRLNQKDFLDRMSALDYKCAVVYSFDAFKDLVNWYFAK